MNPRVGQINPVCWPFNPDHSCQANILTTVDNYANTVIIFVVPLSLYEYCMLLLCYFCTVITFVINFLNLFLTNLTVDEYIRIAKDLHDYNMEQVGSLCNFLIYKY